jgi:signal transduction histidine kinase/tetratricopeptide (TPR) repeat protein
LLGSIGFKTAFYFLIIKTNLPFMLPFKSTALLWAMLTFSTFVVTNPVFSQSTTNVDSLTALLDKYPKEDTVKAKLLIAISEAQNIKWNYKEALANSDKALGILAKFDALELKADALKAKAISLIEDIDDKAIDVAQKHLVVCKQLNRPQKMTEAHNLLGQIYTYRYDIENAKKHYDSAFVLSKQIDNIKLKCNILYELSHCYHHLTDYKQQIICLEIMFELAQKNNNKDDQSMAIGDMGLAYKLLGDNIKAIDCLQKAMRIDESINSNYFLAYDYWSLGDVYRNLSDFDKALEHYNIALNLVLKTNNKKLEPEVYSLAYLYSDMKRHKDALSAITKSIETQKRLGADESKFQGWMHLGNINYEAGNRIEAYGFYQKGLDVSRKEKHPLETASILNSMGKIYAKEPDAVLMKIGLNPAERYSKVETFATEALDIGRKNNSLEQARKALELLSMAHEGNKDYIKAYDTYKQYIALKDSSSGDEVKKQITRKEIQYEFDKKETAFKYQQQLTTGELEKQKLLTIQQGQALTLNQQNLTLKEQALALSNKQKDLEHLAYLKEQAEKQEKAQELTLSQEREKGKERDLNLKNLELSAQQKQNLYLGLLATVLLGGLGISLYFYRLLKKKNTTISQQNELNEQTIAILSHDIKEPLLGVKLLLKKLNKDDPFVAQASQSLEGQINSVNGILTNLLKMKKLSLVKKDKNATANANAVVQNVVRELSVAIQTKALTINNELTDDLTLPIAPEKLQIIVHNLLSNAVKYSFPNQQIRIYKEGKGICIQDFGIGLSPEQRTKLMREVTASQRGTNQERGNGLGLFLVGSMLQGEQLRVVFDSPEVGGTIAKVLG